MTRALIALVLAFALTACEQKQAGPTPPPHELTAEAIGHYCGMNVLEHPGPKGQIILESRLDPVWFSSARDAIAFTLLPEEARDIRAVYVSDMGRAESWDQPGTTDWIEARKAWFVLDSRKRGGMGAEEAVPFSTREAAERFAGANGGRIARLSDIPRDYVLGGTAPGMTPETAPDTAPREPPAPQQ